MSGGLTGAVTEDDAQASVGSGALAVSDPDTALTADDAAFVAQTKEGEYGTFTLAANGEWTYELNNADADTEALVAGEMVTERFTVASADGTTGVVVVTVTGADDAARIRGHTADAVTEDDARKQAGGTPTVGDSDAGEDWAWDVETPKEEMPHDGEMLVSVPRYFPVPGVPGWLMDFHETNFADEIHNEDAEVGDFKDADFSEVPWGYASWPRAAALQTTGGTS